MATPEEKTWGGDGGKGIFMKRVLFICTKNSARSQMAEGLVNHDLAGEFQAFSAGTDPSDVHPVAVAVMGELGIDISHHRSKSMDEFANEKFDYVITLCDQANESCPVFFGGTQRLHMGFDDPAAAMGSEEEKRSAFRKVRDQIREKVVGFLSKQ
jgi:arsenate reductase (thioredoxin)